MTSSTTTTTKYRDRTAEFHSITQTLKKIGGVAPVHQNKSYQANNSSPSKPLLSYTTRSEFNKKASLIGSGVHETSQKISRLAQLAKRSSMFNDPTVEIQELTVLIKNDITALNAALTDLQTIQNMEIADGNYSEDRFVHSTTVCDDLKSKLMGATKRLQDVLTTRTENIKAHENRKQIFSTNVSRENPFLRQAKPMTEPPPWSNPSNAFANSQPSGLPPNGVQIGNQLRRRPAVDNTPSQHMEMSMLQQVNPRQESYTESRAVALHNVESTISELGGIFTHLATMVAQQGELAIRIDDNMDASLNNVENARGSLLRHLNQISSNRWLMVKIFAVIIFFLVVFILFVA
ncbi:PREDICTED: syntaxin-31 [Populus euphratica]|uniref:Syntaxin-31 n=1 Tax=Populus euphratica TaxID=75702 RepID=A0AAJ6UUR8_POPEU|nr:PREDICTED: syntaxin-31 [Populus euphratica]